MRFQLQKTAIQVIELIPPAVATELMPGGSTNPRAMSLNEFVAESIALLKTQPDASEICVERVKFLRYATDSGQFDAVFNMLNPIAVQDEAELDIVKNGLPNMPQQVQP